MNNQIPKVAFNSLISGKEIDKNKYAKWWVTCAVLNMSNSNHFLNNFLLNNNKTDNLTFGSMVRCSKITFALPYIIWHPESKNDTHMWQKYHIKP